MAIGMLYGSATTVDYQPAGFVYARTRWEDEWEWVPYVHPVRVEEGAGSRGSYAEMRYEYGTIKREDDWAFAEYWPEPLMGNFVKITKADFWGEETVFVGYVVDDQDSDGNQTFRAVGLEYFLETKILYAMTDTGSVDRPLAFNSRGGWGQDLEYNKAPGELLFGRGEEWTRLDMLKYLLTHFLVDSPMQWDLDGDADADGGTFDTDASPGIWMLEQIAGQVNVWGMTIREALDVLIEKERGLGWCIDVWDDVAYIRVFSLFDEDTQYESPFGRVRANAWQEFADLDGMIDVLPTLNFSALERYTKVVAIGGPVYVCGTFSVSDGTLEPDWSEEQENAYMTAMSDEARRASSVRGVFTRFRVPSTWDVTLGGVNARPDVLADGSLDPDTPAQWHYWGHTFDREIPIQITRKAFDGDLEAESYQGPFAIIKTKDGKWQFIDRMLIGTGEDERIFGFSILLNDKDMGLDLTSPGVGHLLKLGTTPNSEVEGIADWQTLLFTAMWQSDMRLRAEVTIGPTEHWRVLTISLPEAVAQYVLPGTVIDVNGTELLTDEAGGDYRNDRDRLMAIARQAASWYGRERATMRLTVKQLTVAHPIGSMLVAAGMGGAYVELGTVVTRRIYDFVQGETLIETGHSELRFQGFG